MEHSLRHEFVFVFWSLAVGMILAVVLVAVAQDFGFAQPAWDLVYQGNMSNKCSCFFDILLSTVLNQRLDHHSVSFFCFSKPSNKQTQFPCHC